MAAPHAPRDRATDSDQMSKLRHDSVSALLRHAHEPRVVEQYLGAVGEWQERDLVLQLPRFDDPTLRQQVASLLFREVPEAERAAAAVASLFYEHPHDVPGVGRLLGLGSPWFERLLPRLMKPPSFFREAGEIPRYLAHAESVLAAVARRLGESPDGPRSILDEAVRRTNLIPLYFNDRSLRHVAQARAEMTERWLRGQGSVLELPPRAPRRGGRTRIGAFRPTFDPCAETAALLPHLNGLDRDRYEVVFYGFQAPSTPEAVAAAALADRFVVLDATLVRSAVEALRADDLDLLLIGTNITAVMSTPWLIFAHRVARCQVALSLCPVTTCLSSVDVFLSGRLNEPDDAQREYSERLVLCEGAINSYALPATEGAGEPVGLRASAGWSPDQVVFASGANFFKLTPELMGSWADVLREAPGSRLVLYPFNPNWTSSYPKAAFAKHIRQTMRERGVDGARVVVMDAFESRRSVLGLLREVDVYLDSHPFTGAVSLCDPLLVGVPAVVLEGVTARCRQSAAFLRELGLEELVVQTPEEYVALAVSLAADPARRAAVRGRVEAAKGPGFPDDRAMGARVARVIDALASSLAD